MKPKICSVLAVLIVFGAGCDVGVKPEPKITGDLDSEQLPDGRLRVTSRTEDVDNEGTYRFTVGHCGLNHMIDFDGSFWDSVEPPEGTENLPFFINSDVGTITFERDDDVFYEASTGERIELKRIEGPIEIDLCG